jgi:hypothetical protein
LLWDAIKHRHSDAHMLIHQQVRRMHERRDLALMTLMKTASPESKLMLWRITTPSMTDPHMPYGLTAQRQCESLY